MLSILTFDLNLYTCYYIILCYVPNLITLTTIKIVIAMPKQGEGNKRKILMYCLINAVYTKLARKISGLSDMHVTDIERWN